MATELGSAFISVGMGTNTLAGDIKKAFGSAESSGSSAGKSAGKGFGLGFAGIATAAIGALGIGTFLKGAITGAGDLQQSVGGIEAVFKGASGEMLAFSDGAAKAIGLTKNEYNELGTVIGSQLKNGGVASDQLAGKTNDLITTGGDLAAMFGGTTADAVGALSSALKGERDPIERYGVSLNQAKIDAEAAALGFSKVGGSLSAEATQAATMSLIMKQTADATGAAARESGTFAAQQKQMSSGFKNLQADIGAAFLPALTGVFSFINTSILPSLDKFVAALGGGGLAGAFAPIMAVAGPMFASLGASFGPLIPQVVQLVSSFSPLGLLFKVLTPILPMLATAFTQIAGTIAGVLAIVIPLVSSLVSQLVPIILQLVSSVLPPLAAVFGELVAAVGPFVSQLATALIPIIQALMPVVVNVFNTVASIITSVMQIVMGVIQTVTGIISGNWSHVWDGISNVFGGIWNTIVAVVSGAVSLVGATIGAGLGVAVGLVGGALGNIARFFSDTWKNVVNGVSSMISQVTGFFSGLMGKITGAIGNAGTALLSVGKSIVQGLINGITSMMGKIGAAILSLVPGPIVGVFKDLLGIHSPSRVFRGFGVNIGEGLILGLDDMHGDIGSAMSSLVTVPSVPAFGAGSFTSSLGISSGSMSPAFNVYVGNEQLDSRMYRVADSAISSADSNSTRMRRGR